MDMVHATANAASLRTRAAELIKAGRIGAARPLLAAALALDAPSPDLALTSARLALKTGNYGKAIDGLDIALAADPAHAGLRKCRAEARIRAGDHEGGARDAAEALIADPTDANAKALLGVALNALGLTADGTACLQEAVRNEPANQSYREALANGLDNAGDSDAALRVLIDGIAFAPSNVAMRNAAVLACIRRRDFTQAARLAEDARSAGVADACTFGLKGHALSSLGEHDRAATAYRDALMLAPEDPYVRHLVAASGAVPGARRAPEDYVRTVFDGYADRFENHLISLSYGIPVAIRNLLVNHPRIASGLTLGPILDLGCGTGLVALAIGDLPVTSFTGVDLSPGMLAHARAKRIYSELREADIVADLVAHEQRWPLIIAADVLCYFGALEELFDLVHQRLEPGGWFVFSLEQILPDSDGVIPGNGNWALQRMGRYAHADHYIYEIACAAGFRIVRVDRPVVRQEAGIDVPGLLFAIEHIRHDD